MNGINIELLKKIKKLDDEQQGILLNLLNLLNNAKSYSEKKEVQSQFRIQVNKLIDERNDDN